MFVKNGNLFRHNKDLMGTPIASLLASLTSLKRGYIDFPSEGICSNICGASAYGVDIVDFLAEDWEHYSGNPSYPVPSTNKHKTASDMYYSALHMWGNTTKYSRLRMDLVDHCIKKLNMLNTISSTEKKVNALIQSAKANGLIVEINVKTDSENPSMNNHEMVGSVRLARGNY